MSTELESRLADIDRRAAAVTDLRAEFTQTRRTPMLRKPLESSGTVLVRGDVVRWDTRRPHASTMVIGGGEVRLHYPDEKVLEVYEARGDLRELTGSPLPRLAVLRERFAIAHLAVSEIDAKADGEHLLALELTPGTAELKEHATTVRVLIDAGVPCLRVMEMTDPDGEVTRTEFRRVRVNEGIKDSELELRVPEGTRTVRPLGSGAGDTGK